MKTIHSMFRKCTVAVLAATVMVSLTMPLHAAPNQGYTVSNLVSDLPGVAANLDTNLTNPWGLVFDNFGDPIIADNHSDLATFYGPDGLVVPFSINAGIAPTGVEFNRSTNDFKVGPATNKQSAQLLFCTESGTILGFTLAVDFNTAELMVDDSASGAVFKGLTLARMHGKQYLYAADFHNKKIKVYDGNFQFVGSFTDPHMEAGYAPFNIRNIGGFLFVTFAKQKGPAATDDQAGAGNGFVEIFTPNGVLLRRLISHGNLNSPWGITYVPFTFGKLGGSLLVGNFGDGRINAYNPLTGKFLGTLNNPNGTPITIPGLWSLKVQPHINDDGDDDCDDFRNIDLYFTAGPNDENHGIFGVINPVSKH